MTSRIASRFQHWRQLVSYPFLKLSMVIGYWSGYRIWRVGGKSFWTEQTGKSFWTEQTGGVICGLHRLHYWLAIEATFVMEFESNISKLQIGNFLSSQLQGTKSICLSKSWPLKKGQTLAVADKSLLLFVTTVDPISSYSVIDMVYT